MSKWSVYIVRCADGTLYTGITTDIAARLAKHNSGDGAKYTRSRRPVELVWSRAMKSESAARKGEAAIKRMSRKSKELMIQKLSDSDAVQGKTEQRSEAHSRRTLSK